MSSIGSGLSQQGARPCWDEGPLAPAAKSAVCWVRAALKPKHPPTKDWIRTWLSAWGLLLSADMPDTLPNAAQFLPAKRDLKSLREAAKHCEGCPLFAKATQTVFGAGPARAELMMVGEQPGDYEDRQGEPFVGPAGRLLNEMMEQAGIPRERVYVTNAVKHFKWTSRGKRRLHGKPNSREIFACRPWLEAELAAVKPDMLVLLGSTAAQSLLGPKFRITKERGKLLETDFAPWTIATYHPSALLRAIHDPGGEQLRAEFLADLRLVARKLHALK